MNVLVLSAAAAAAAIIVAGSAGADTTHSRAAYNTGVQKAERQPGNGITMTYPFETDPKASIQAQSSKETSVKITSRPTAVLWLIYRKHNGLVREQACTFLQKQEMA